MPAPPTSPAARLRRCVAALCAASVLALVVPVTLPAEPVYAVSACGPTLGYGCLSRYGYSAAHTGTWAEKYYRRPESGCHNCTRFAAFYLARFLGVGDPGHSFGDAWNWGLTDAEGGQRDRISPKELGYPIDHTPRIGAVAWWERTHRSEGHVGIVVDVGPGYVMVASDSYKHGTTEIARLSPGRLYPTAFIHMGPRRPGGVAPSSSVCVAARGAVPGDLVVVNVTVTDAWALGWGAVRPSGTLPVWRRVQRFSNVNFGPGWARPNAAVVAVGGDGRFCYDGAVSRHHVVLDQLAVIEAASVTATDAVRLADTRR